EAVEARGQTGSEHGDPLTGLAQQSGAAAVEPARRDGALGLYDELHLVAGVPLRLTGDQRQRPIEEVDRFTVGVALPRELRRLAPVAHGTRIVATQGEVLGELGSDLHRGPRVPALQRFADALVESLSPRD